MKEEWVQSREGDELGFGVTKVIEKGERGGLRMTRRWRRMKKKTSRDGGSRGKATMMPKIPIVGRDEALRRGPSSVGVVRKA